MDEKNTDGEKYMTCFVERDELFERYNECLLSDDYAEIAKHFGARIANEAELYMESVKKLGIPITVISAEDCIPDHYTHNITGKVIAIDKKHLNPEFQRADRQLYLVYGGSGASANTRGSAVFCTNLHTGENCRWERYMVMGEVKPECIPKHALETYMTMLTDRGYDVAVASLENGERKVYNLVSQNKEDPVEYLGGNEQSTHKYVSELLGKATIDTNTYGKSEGRSGSYSTNYQISGRELLTPDEVRIDTLL